MVAAILVSPYSRWDYEDHRTVSVEVEVGSVGNFVGGETCCYLKSVLAENIAEAGAVIGSKDCEK